MLLGTFNYYSRAISWWSHSWWWKRLGFLQSRSLFFYLYQHLFAMCPYFALWSVGGTVTTITLLCRRALSFAALWSLELAFLLLLRVGITLSLGIGKDVVDVTVIFFPSQLLFASSVSGQHLLLFHFHQNNNRPPRIWRPASQFVLQQPWDVVQLGPQTLVMWRDLPAEPTNGCASCFEFEPSDFSPVCSIEFLPCSIVLFASSTSFSLLPSFYGCCSSISLRTFIFRRS